MDSKGDQSQSQPRKSAHTSVFTISGTSDHSFPISPAKEKSKDAQIQTDHELVEKEAYDKVCRISEFYDNDIGGGENQYGNSADRSCIWVLCRIIGG